MGDPFFKKGIPGCNFIEVGIKMITRQATKIDDIRFGNRATMSGQTVTHI